MSKDKISYSEDDFKKISREMNALYEQNKEITKENKRLKNELKISQERERDYMSVLKNTSEFSKVAINNID